MTTAVLERPATEGGILVFGPRIADTIVVIPRGVLQDESLSYAACGVYAVLEANDFRVNVRWLIDRGAAGKAEEVRAALMELVAAGYVRMPGVAS